MKFLLAIGLLFSVVKGANAQGRPEIGIFEVSLNESTPTRQTLGRSIDLTLESQSRLPEQFHVRLIRGEKRELIADGRRRADHNGCVTYFSVVIPVRRSNVDGAIHLGTLEDPSYLRIEGSHFAEEDYVLVFEHGDQPSDSVLRIHRDHLESYFKFGFPMQLRPSDRLMQKVPTVVAAAATTLENRGKRFRELANYKTDSTIPLARPATPPCWAVKIRTDMADAASFRGSVNLVAALQECEAPTSRPTIFSLDVSLQDPALAVSGQELVIPLNSGMR